MNKRVFAHLTVMLTAALLITGCKAKTPDQAPTDNAAPAAETQIAEEQAPETLTVGFRDVRKHGNIILDTTFDEMRAAGMDIGDIITVVVGDAEYDIPIGTSHSDVDSGEMICRFDLEDNEVSVAVNMGSFAEAAGIAEKRTIDADPGYEWDIKVSEIGLRLKEKGGYLEEYRARNLTRTDVREDYADLTDAEFANFRAVSVSGVKEGTLYRSSSPVDPSIGRNEYAMATMEAAGIRTVINLSDAKDVAEAFDTYEGSYYSTCNVIYPEMNFDYHAKGFSDDVKASVQFMAENDGPYLVHCKEGKDRTGMLCAVLECFAGATYDEVCTDYMLTYQNFYGVGPDDSAYAIILNSNLNKTLCSLFGVEDLSTADLKAEASEYLLSTGLSQEDLDALSSKIGA